MSSSLVSILQSAQLSIYIILRFTSAKIIDGAGFSKSVENWKAEVEDDLNAFKELGQSKWSKDFEDDTEKYENAEGNTHALSGLAQTYSTHKKRVSWGDRVRFMFQCELYMLTLLRSQIFKF